MTDYVKTATFRVGNTLHGFAQCGNDVQLALVPDELSDESAKKWLDTISVETGATSLHIVRGYGRALALEAAKDYDKRRAILNSALAHLPEEMTVLSLQTFCAPLYQRGETVSVTTTEQKFRARLGSDKYLQLAVLRMRSWPPVNCVQMWKTEEMRTLIQQLIDSYDLRSPDLPDVEDTIFGDVVDLELDWPPVSTGRELLRPRASPSIVPAEPEKPAPAPEDLCMICFERPPDTMVLPCQHVVACNECSRQLRGGPNAKLCIKCRVPLTHVLDT